MTEELYPTLTQELVAACSGCIDTITQVAETEQPTSTDWINLRSARAYALRAIDRAARETPELPTIVGPRTIPERGGTTEKRAWRR